MATLETEPLSQTLTVLLPASFRRWLDDRAALEDRSVGWLVRQAISLYVELVGNGDGPALMTPNADAFELFREVVMDFAHGCDDLANCDCSIARAARFVGHPVKVDVAWCVTHQGVVFNGQPPCDRMWKRLGACVVRPLFLLASEPENGADSEPK